MTPADPHRGGPVLAAGQPLDQAAGALILVHGRGDSAVGILGLAEVLHQPDFAYLAPQAAGGTWYPYSFLAPITDNEPGISSGIATLGDVVESVAAAGLPYERIVIGGFSQGACLVCEFVARHPGRYGGLLAFSGGLIGPDGTPRDYAGDLEGTPVFLGCSDVDFHIPKQRVELTSQVLEGMGAEVTLRLYPGMGHTINQEEIDFGRTLLAAVT
ncbi:MAG TPA: dienelactone hydrolase family protein [Anaerolineae bacterium]|jgi:predicted esterase|nr:dienelactone hydrolase family protein [Anaerolineae bacterium]